MHKIPKFHQISRFVILLLASLLYGCSTEESPNLISQVESNLIPAIVLSGQEIATYSIDERMEYHKVPGVSIAYIDNGAIVWAKGYGYLSADRTAPVDTTTRFQAASISKPVAAALALKLVEDSILSLTRDVNEYPTEWQLPVSDYTQNDKVTIRHLLSHTGGLNVHGFGGYEMGNEFPSTAEVLAGTGPTNSAALQSDTVPGTIWKYSGGGYTLLQHIIETVAERPFEEVIRDEVLQPLNMKNSTYAQPPPAALSRSMAVGHNGNGEKVAGSWHVYPEKAAAGLWTTPSDLAKFLIEMQKSARGESNKVLSQEMTNTMLEPGLGNWGLGFSITASGDSLRFGHGGSNFGYKCNFFGFLNKDQGVVVMTNGDNGSALYREIYRSFSKVYNWNIFNPITKTVVEMPSSSLSLLEGIYVYSPNVKAKVSVDENMIRVDELWDFSRTLYAEGDNKFFDPSDGTSLEFKADESSGEINEMILDGRYSFSKE